MPNLWDLISEALVITGFVFVMMLVVEYLSVLTRGRADRAVAKRGAFQKLVTATLGVSPGCLGAYIVSSLYIHRIVSFGALSAAMIATCGDEAFLLLALAPEKAFLLFGTLFATGLLSGAILDRISHRPPEQTPIAEHAHDTDKKVVECIPFSRKQLIDQWRHCSPHRGWLTLMLLLFVIGVASGRLGHQHIEQELPEHSEAAHAGETVHQPCPLDEPHDHARHAEEEHHAATCSDHDSIDAAEHDHGSEWNWVRITLLLVGLIGLAIVTTVPDHFLEDHLWKHLVRVHAWRIFLWIAGAVLFTRLLVDRIDIGAALQNHQLPLLLIALLVGLIPVSGPHLIFVTLFAEGAIPFSALLANSIVQDGHGMLPVLAHDRKTFFRLRLIKLAIGLLLGLTLQLAGH
jgi:hypothetical protein